VKVIDNCCGRLLVDTDPRWWTISFTTKTADVALAQPAWKKMT
jgi:hypothetical protein